MSNLQQIFAPEPQSAFDLGEPRQNLLSFPASLDERYQPRRVSEFIGIANVKSKMAGLIAAPRPCGFIFVGPPGTGKSCMAMALAEELPGTLYHVGSQQCDVASLEALKDTFAYYPPKGKFWICLVDEADQMTEKAQLHLLSRLDGTAALKPLYGGGFELGERPPIIWIFTCNGHGPYETDLPASLLSRFRSRNMVLAFPAVEEAELIAYLAAIWQREAPLGSRLPDLEQIVRESANNVRDALKKLELALMGAEPPPPPENPQVTKEATGGIISKAVSRLLDKLEDEMGEPAAAAALESALRDCGSRIVVGELRHPVTVRAINRVSEIKLLNAIKLRVLSGAA